MAGKVVVVQGNKLVTKYWHTKNEPLLKIANLAIHLTDKSGVFEPNKETHLKPILATSIVDQLTYESKD
jgi:aspartyl aminopeptidase